MGRRVDPRTVLWRVKVVTLDKEGEEVTDKVKYFGPYPSKRVANRMRSREVNSAKRAAVHNGGDAEGKLEKCIPVWVEVDG
jgi:hypothetical protein